MNSPNPILAALLSICMSVVAQFVLKTGVLRAQAEAQGPLASWPGVLALASNGYVICGFLLYALGAGMWLLVLAQWDVSKAYPLVGLGFVIALAIGYFNGEAVSFSRIAGVMLICCGVWLTARS